MAAKAKASNARFDAAFIRKSSQQQDERAQIAVVKGKLEDAGARVTADHWFVGTVSRSKVRGNPEFIRLMELVEADKVGTVYIESQDRWGTSDRPELFRLLGILREHKTRLFDLQAQKDITERDLATEMLAFVNSIKSEKEQQDLSRRSLRTRVENFLDSGSWPTGPHPFGYGKACYTPDDELIWEWQPATRTKGQIFYPDPKRKGKLLAGQANVGLPRKTKGDRSVTRLVPSNNRAFVDSIKMIFDLYTRVGLSRRKISARLNEEGRRFYDHEFTHPLVTQILKNPAYAGDVHFGKTKAGNFNSFDAKGRVHEVERNGGTQKREVAQRLVKERLHKPLIDRKVWDAAQKKLASEQERTSYSPRNPNYYLKQLLVCGHCGKGMVGRTAQDGSVLYVCSTYIKGRCNGHPSPCGYHSITHAEAERRLLLKIEQLDLEFDSTASEQARGNLEARLAKLAHDDEEFAKQWRAWVSEGVSGVIAYLQSIDADLKYDEVRLLKRCVRDHFHGEKMESVPKRLPIKLADLKKAIRKAEKRDVDIALRKVEDLTNEHKSITLAWIKASELQQAVLKEENDRVEAELAKWKPRTTPLSQRFNELFAAEAEVRADRAKLHAEWPELDNREKGEALRRLFTKVTLFWEPTFHKPEAKPKRPRKTNRGGRFTYAIERILWAFTSSNLGVSW